MHLKQTLSKVLWGLEILQVTSDVFAGVELFALGSVAVVSEDDDFVDFEDAGNSSDFADEVSPEWRSLRDFQDGIGEANGKMRQFARSPFFLLRLLFINHPRQAILTPIVILSN